MLMSEVGARDVLAMVAVLGTAAFAWFGWAQENPPTSWRVPLAVGAALGLALAVAGGIATWRHWGATTALDGAAAGTHFGVVVAVEVLVAAAGAVVLVALGQAAWMSAWICAVVGVHFVPLGSLFGDRGLWVLGALLVAVAVLAVVVGRGRGAAPSAVVGAGAGIVFLLFAARGVASALTRGIV